MSADIPALAVGDRVIVVNDRDAALLRNGDSGIVTRVCVTGSVYVRYDTADDLPAGQTLELGPTGAHRLERVR